MGIVFRRTDLDGFEVEASSRNVAKVSYATSLMKKGVLISTTEHLLSAFIGMGVDNAIVELNNLELPILDGSALPFVEMLTHAGLRQQRRKRVYLKILRPYEMREGDKFIGVYPAERYSVSYAINFPHPLIGSERFQVELSNGSYVEQIASARTFGFLEQQRAMLNMGLIRGASRENCIVLTAKGIDNPPLRHADEFVRHKVLGNSSATWHCSASAFWATLKPIVPDMPCTPRSSPVFCVIPPMQKKLPWTKRRLPIGRPNPSPPLTS